MWSWHPFPSTSDKDSPYQIFKMPLTAASRALFLRIAVEKKWWKNSQNLFVKRMSFIHWKLYDPLDDFPSLKRRYASSFQGFQLHCAYNAHLKCCISGPYDRQPIRTTSNRHIPTLSLLAIFILTLCRLIHRKENCHPLAHSPDLVLLLLLLIVHVLVLLFLLLVG